MNRIYRLVWSQISQAWVAVAENARSHGKSIPARKLIAVAAATMGGSLLVASAYAASSSNATVVNGSGSVTQSGATTVINQTSQRLAIDWSNLSTAANEALVFRQPNAAAIALNRITGSSPSALLGSLTANGQVYILNPNGVLFGSGAQVNVGGLVASTLTMDPADFMNGGSTFSRKSGAGGSVVNQGLINAASGGYVALLSGTVRNEGTINAPLGTALLAAGDKVTLNVNNGSLIGYSIDQGDLNALIENRQMIRADGGQVLMVARALDKLSTAVINNTGVVEARTVQNRKGHILLLGDMDNGTVNVAGTLDASAPTTGDGGFIETSAAHVKVAEGVRVSTQAAQGLTGSWLIDPVDFTVAASGGDMSGATLSASLGTTDVELQSTQGLTPGNGDININDTVSWNAPHTLTLSAQRNININQSISATNGGKLMLQYGLAAVNAGNTATVNVRAPVNLQAGNNFSTRLGSDGAIIQYTVITDLDALQSINYGSPDTNYALGSNIDASATASWNAGEGFLPLGNFSGGNYGYQSIFDGLGHTISNLLSNWFTWKTGLFVEITTTGVVRNLGLPNVNVINSDSMSGGLVAMNHGLIENCYVTGNVSGAIDAGGLSASNYGTIRNSYAAVNVSTVDDLVDSFAGGLVGLNDGGTIINSYATGNVSSPDFAGGLVGTNSAIITDSYASGRVSGGSWMGGLVGNGSRGVTGSFWNLTSSGMSAGSSDGADSPGITGIDNTAASQLATFKNAGWDINDAGGTGSAWRIYDGHSGPLLRSFLQQITVTGDAVSRTYNGTTTTAAGTYSVAGGVTLDGSLSYVTSKNAGSYSTADGTLAGTGLYSGQQGYDIIYTGASVTINKASVTLSTSDVTKTYDGTTAAAGTAVATSGTIFAGDSLSGGSYAYTDKNAGSGNKTVTVGDVTINDGNNGNNYNVTYINNTHSTINKANVTLSTADVTKTYDGTAAAAGSAVASSGTIFAGDSLSGGSYAFTDKNAGSGNKTVTVGGITVNDGNNGNNYNVTYADNTTSTISKADIVLSSSDVTKTYDGTTSAAGTVVTSSGTVFAGDSLSGGSFAFTDKNAGTGNKTVTTSGVIVNDGNNGNNYNVTYADNTSSTINKADVTLSTSDVTKTYDGTTSAAGTAIVSAGTIFSGDNISGGSYAYTDKNAGSGNKTVTTSGVTINDGNNGNNYNVTYADNTSSTINKANVTLSSSDVTKTYDGTTSAGGTAVTSAGVIFSGDSLSGGTFAFTDKNAGTRNKTVTVGGITVNDGNNGNNYNVTYADNTTSTISKADIVLSSSDVTKTYDGTTSAAGTVVTSSGTVFAGDSLSGGSFAFTDKNAGAGNKSVTVSGVTVNDGNNGNNYNVTYVDNTTSTINKADLTITAHGADKVYDGLTDASLTYTDNRIAGDMLDIGGTGSFSDKNAGTNKTIIVGGITLNGTDAGNYNVISAGNTSADITPAALTVTANADSKPYDGHAYTGGNDVTFSGLVNGDTAADLMGVLAYGGSSQGAIEAGDYSITPGGLNGNNYTIHFVDGVLTILQAVRTAPDFTSMQQSYDGARDGIAHLVSGPPSLQKSKDADVPGYSPGNDRSGAQDGIQVTPRLNLAGCGMSMPANAAGGGCR